MKKKTTTTMQRAGHAIGGRLAARRRGLMAAGPGLCLAGLCLAGPGAAGLAGCREEPPVAAHTPEAPLDVLYELPAFEMTNQAGERFGSAELAGHPYAVTFFFTSCSSICPELMKSMRSLQNQLVADGVDGARLVSISVDPETDTPEIIRAYGERHGVDPARWILLTGDEEQTKALAREGFKTQVGEREANAMGAIDIVHSSRIIVVDGQGRIRGYFDSTDEQRGEVVRALRALLGEAPR